MTDIDKMLRDSLNRLAVPADPTGVAEAIQARVDAGDTGTQGPTRGGGGFGGLPPWAPWLGLIVVAGLVGGVLGGLGVFGRPAAASASYASVLESGVAGLSCPGGSIAASFPPGERVLATSRSADSAYLGVRDPSDRSRTVWVLTSKVVADPHEKDIASLPVAGCPIPTLTLPQAGHATSTPSSTPSPTKTTPPTKPVPDTTPPTIGVPTANRGSNADPVCINHPFDPAREKATITVSASDNRGVTGVSISWTGPGSDHGSGAMTRSGSVWKYTYDPVSMTSSGVVGFLLQSRDAAGNKSPFQKIDLEQEGCVD